MTFEEDFPSLKGKVIYSQAYEDGSLEHPDTLIKEVVAENCLDKQKVRSIIESFCNKLSVPMTSIRDGKLKTEVWSIEGITKTEIVRLGQAEIVIQLLKELDLEK